MRAWAVFAIIVGASRPAIADRAPVDPAFLGVQLGAGVTGVLVTEVEDGTGAMQAGLQAGDEIIRVDGTAVTTAIFTPVIMAHQPGETVHLLVVRNGRPLAIDATLSTRQDVLQRRLVGRPAPVTNLTDLEDRHAIDLSALQGRSAVVAFVSTPCDDCGTVLRRVRTWTLHHRGRASSPLALAVVVDDARHPATEPSVGGLPVAGASLAAFEQFVVSGVDKNRITFVVIDARGRIALVSPIAGTDDDAMTALDDVLAACDQAERHAGSR